VTHDLAYSYDSFPALFDISAQFGETMKKIISLFQRNYETDHLVRDEVVPGAEWVVAGEGVATRKWDGTCCLIQNGKFYKRYDAKAFTVDLATGERIPWGRKPPKGFIPAQEPDPITGHYPGWLEVNANAPEDKYFLEGILMMPGGRPVIDGTYELIGAKVNGNREKIHGHKLVKHGDDIIEGCPRDFEGLKAFLQPLAIEGIVFHHPDGRMVKIKRRDFFKGKS
jgi:hypothetical protein